jgi:hypothetical protein
MQPSRCLNFPINRGRLLALLSRRQGRPDRSLSARCRSVRARDDGQGGPPVRLRCEAGSHGAWLWSLEARPVHHQTTRASGVVRLAFGSSLLFS